MITYSKILHKKAMELVDEAQMEGNKQMAQTLLKMPSVFIQEQLQTLQ